MLDFVGNHVFEMIKVLKVFGKPLDCLLALLEVTYPNCLSGQISPSGVLLKSISPYGVLLLLFPARGSF